MSDPERACEFILSLAKKVVLGQDYSIPTESLQPTENPLQLSVNGKKNKKIKIKLK